MTNQPKFIQITSSHGSFGVNLYALDENGNVWGYGYDKDGGHWYPLGMERK